MWREDKEDALKNAKKTLIKLLRFTLISTIFVSIVNTLICLKQNKGPFEWFTLFSGGNRFRDFLLINKTFFLSAVLWYLFAMIYVELIYILLLKFNLLKKSYFLIIPLIIGNIIINEYYHLDWLYSSNWLFTGVPFVLLGSYLHSSKWWRKIPAYISWIMIIVGIISILFEIKQLGECYFYIGSVPMILGIYMLVIKGESITYPKFLSDFGAKCTQIIYVLHFSLRNVIYEFFGKPTEPLMIAVLPVIVFALSSIIAIIVVFIKECYLKNNVKKKKA